MLGLAPSLVSNLEFHELASLLYRDTVAVKHQNRDRLAQELGLKGQEEEREKKKKTSRFASQQQKSDFMAEMVVEHLKAVS